MIETTTISSEQPAPAGTACPFAVDVSRIRTKNCERPATVILPAVFEDEWVTWGATAACNVHAVHERKRRQRYADETRSGRERVEHKREQQRQQQATDAILDRLREDLGLPGTATPADILARIG